MKGETEFTGILRGFDAYLTMILEDVTVSTLTNHGVVSNKMSRALVNGRCICMVRFWFCFCL
ncbi:uncharacterized protein [Blastocystis hominis]|uniref:Sm domain-containing protein n=1 Tax=Blastocystis hominis TaxID=12968 RepID=D8M507_BLAHO|nr:uncharacterized protein [Blastocystis hominis]CBK23146.2 unnamed protein product [Blastocystis hominis]|eukprot:XP_012897194.1 uncharacterized protein [Blastocystis hominis]